MRREVQQRANVVQVQFEVFECRVCLFHELFVAFFSLLYLQLPVFSVLLDVRETALVVLFGALLADIFGEELAEDLEERLGHEGKEAILTLGQVDLAVAQLGHWQTEFGFLVALVPELFGDSSAPDLVQREGLGGVADVWLRSGYLRT